MSPRPQQRTAHAPAAGAGGRRSAVRALGADLLVVLVFAAVGRAAHDGGVSLLGVVATAAPFAAGTLAARLAPVVRASPRSWRSGAVVLAATVLVGVVLRLLSGEGAPPSFVVVTVVVLGVLLLGWRLLARRARPSPRLAGR